ncbi:hypothetical protein HRI_000014400 [Hibiscus trionum]|uniref:Aspartic peptidase DDI1-type domain-containing protein n=1 Tax=Hibiscus trionum TaxID=183268 RepID=A0A9W7GRF8_HIBTR|nr:hypothetical protein HRI_000014400 [Hibiscus trionum]
MNHFVKKMKTFMDKTEMRMTNHEATLKSLETQMGQISLHVKPRQNGGFPSNTENARQPTHKQCKAITTRSEKKLQGPEKEAETVKKPALESTVEEAAPTGNKQPAADEPILTAEGTKEKDDEPKPPQIRMQWEGHIADYRPPPPFPQRLQKLKHESQLKKIYDIFKQFHINIPLLDAVREIPGYAKFLKDVMSKKSRLGEFETVNMTHGCMSILHKYPPQMKQDPESFIIPCILGDKFVGKALCDLGASINLMPKSVFQKLGIGKARPTTVVLQLADRSYVHPEGKIEDILVRVDKFIFTADFLILDCEADENAPIILGRPFLATGRSLIDVERGELIMRVNDQEIKLNVLQAMKHADAGEECKTITAITFDQPCIRSGCHDIKIGHCLGSHLEDCHDSTDNSSSSESDTEDQEEVNWIGNHPVKLFEPLNYTSDNQIIHKPSTVEPSVLDLKPLPGQLKYAFLGLNDTLPVIISSKLMQEHEHQLIV